LNSSLNNPELEKRLHLGYQEEDFPEGISSGHLDNDEAVLTASDVIARVLQWLTNRFDPINEDEITQTAAFLEEVIHSPHSTQEVSDHLDEIDNLLPALLELNVRQACGDDRPGLGKELQDLLTNIFLQSELPNIQKVLLW